MIELQTGDLLRAPAEALVNTVNCDGFMGRGIAAQFKRAYPANFKRYELACKRGEVQPGKMLVVATEQTEGPRCIINFPTKRHWRQRSRIEDIASGLDALIADLIHMDVHTVAVPPLGCGLGGLDWQDVRPLIERAFARVPHIRVMLFAPQPGPSATAMAKPTEPLKMTPGRAVLVGLIDRYLAGLMDPFVSLLEIHKLTYFSQCAGEDLRLRFCKAPYGPYAENLRNVMQAVEGHLTQGYADGGDAPDKQIALMEGAAERARAFIADKPAVLGRFERVSELVAGFETPFGMELLATVHWVATKQASDPNSTIAAVHGWNPRKRMFTPGQIELAYKTLDDKGWLRRSN